MKDSLRTGQRSVNSGVECPLALAHPHREEHKSRLFHSVLHAEGSYSRVGSFAP